MMKKKYIVSTTYTFVVSQTVRAKDIEEAKAINERRLEKLSARQLVGAADSGAEYEETRVFDENGEEVGE